MNHPIRSFIRRQVIEVAAVTGWRMVDTADRLYDGAHRLTRGETPKREDLMIRSIVEVAVMAGMPPSAIIAGREADERVRHIAARIYAEVVRRDGLELGQIVELCRMLDISLVDALAEGPR